jgi:hypothetical protein
MGDTRIRGVYDQVFVAASVGVMLFSQHPSHPVEFDCVITVRSNREDQLIQSIDDAFTPVQHAM